MGDSNTKQETSAAENRQQTAQKKKFRHTKKNGMASLYVDNKQALILFAVIIVMLAVILSGILALNIPVVPVCLIAVLEVLLAVCLQAVPVWLHTLAVIAQIVAGAFCAKTVFMLLCAVVYVVSILALKFFRG